MRVHRDEQISYLLLFMTPESEQRTFYINKSRRLVSMSHPLSIRGTIPCPGVALVFRARETLAPFLGTFSGLPPGTLPAGARRACTWR